MAGGNNLNGSFLNASFSSHTGSAFPQAGGSSGLFGKVNPVSFNQPTGGMFGGQQGQTTGGLFGSQQPNNMFMSSAQSAQAAKI